MSDSDVNERLAYALVKLICEARGRRVTIWARLLVRSAGMSCDHRNIIRAARFLKRLAERGLVAVETRKRFSRSRSLNYVLSDDMELWSLAKREPERARAKILGLA